ncbi:MAG: oxidoreductase family protein, partial [Pseudomonadota bacterium]
NESNHVAAVDFQYVGGGCGMKDVAYFLGSCLTENKCQALETELLDFYFSALCNRVQNKHPHIDTDALETEWRSMFDVAWADFHRFLKGWSPGHWKLNSYSELLTRRVIERLQP